MDHDPDHEASEFIAEAGRWATDLGRSALDDDALRASRAAFEALVARGRAAYAAALRLDALRAKIDRTIDEVHFLFDAVAAAPRDHRRSMVDQAAVVLAKYLVDELAASHLPRAYVARLTRVLDALVGATPRA